MLNKMKNAIKSAALEIGTFVTAPSAKQAQCMMYVLGVTLLVLGSANCYAAGLDFDITEGSEGFAKIIGAILAYIEGPFGALLMIVAGIGAIFSAALGSYKAALSLLIVAIGAFILRSLVTGFFGTEVIIDP